MEGALAIVFVFSIPLVAIVTSHRRQVLEMKLRLHNRGDEALRATVEQLRAEVRSLQDTTTQYDMSFDSALQRIERRVDSLENHAISSGNQPVRQVEIQSGR